MNSRTNLVIATVITVCVLGLMGLLALNLEAANNVVVAQNDPPADEPVDEQAELTYEEYEDDYEDDEYEEKDCDEEEHEDDEYEEGESLEGLEGVEGIEDMEAYLNELLEGDFESEREFYINGCEYEYEDGEWEVECEDDD